MDLESEKVIQDLGGVIASEGRVFCVAVCARARQGVWEMETLVVCAALTPWLVVLSLLSYRLLNHARP